MRKDDIDREEHALLIIERINPSSMINCKCEGKKKRIHANGSLWVAGM
jgi:hypothetical protein